jgi:hypothetical protein
VAFEPINEPMIDCPWDGNSRRWPAMAQKLHATARAAAPKLTIVMQGACWGSAEGLADLDPAKFNDRNIIWSFHTYDPMIFTHQGASWVDGPPKFVRNLTYPPQATDKKKIIDATVQAINRSNMSTSNKVQLITDAKAELNDYFSTAELKPAMEQPGRKSTRSRIPEFLLVNSVSSAVILAAPFLKPFAPNILLKSPKGSQRRDGRGLCGTGQVHSG